MLLEIRVKPYVKKFLMKVFEGKCPTVSSVRLHKGINNVLLYNRKDAILQHLYILLREHEERKFLDDYLDAYSDRIGFTIPEHEAFDLKAHYVTSKTIVMFNLFVEELIKKELEYEAMMVNAVNTVIDQIYEDRIEKVSERTLNRAGIKKWSRKEAIEKWKQKYDMSEDDIKSETLKKIFYRGEIKIGLKQPKTKIKVEKN